MQETMWIYAFLFLPVKMGYWFYVSKKFWKFKEIGNSFNIFVFFIKKFMSKQIIYPFLHNPLFSPTPPFLEKLFHLHPYCKNSSPLWLYTAPFDYILPPLTVVVITTAQLHSIKPEPRFCRFKPCLESVGDLRWWGSLTMIPAGNKAKRLSLVNHTTKTIIFLIIILHL